MIAIRRKSTLSFARKHAAPRFPKIAEALDHPMVRDIFDTIDQVRGARFVIMGPPQWVKSLAGQARAMRCMLVEPSASLWYAHPEKFVDDFCDEKFNPLFDAMPVLKPLLFTRSGGDPDPSKRARDRIQFSGSSMLLRSARVPLNRQSKTARDIYVDEPWTYEPGWIEEISKRRGSFDEEKSWREIYMSTGSVRGKTDSGGEFTNIWLSSDMRRWNCRCPACNQLFVPRRTHEDEKTGERIGGLVYETILRPDGLPNEPAIARTVRYRCPRCSHEMPDTAASRRQLNGTAERPRGIFVSENEYAAIAPVTIGWNVPGVAIKPWAPIAIRMVFAYLARQRGDRDPLKKIVLLDDADVWDEAIYFREQKQSPFGAYKMGDEWEDEARNEKKLPWRFATVDVQQDHFVLVIRMWAADSRSRLRYAEKITTAGRLQEVIASHGVLPSRVFLDSRHDPQRVRRLCQAHGWRCVMGEKDRDYRHESGLRRIFSEPQAMDAWQGTGEQGRGIIWEFKFSKNSALSRLHLLRTLESNTAELRWSIAADAPEWYRKEIDAFHRVRKEPEGGEVFYEWQVHGPDHAADAECIQIVAASMADLAGAESLKPAEEKPDDKKP